MKKLLILFIVFIFNGLCVFAHDSGAEFLPRQIGVVESVQYEDIDTNTDYPQVRQRAIVKLLNTESKGGEIGVVNMITGNPQYDINLKKGMKIIIHSEDSDDGIVNSVEDVQRSGVLVLLSIIFCSLLIYVGRKKGLYSLVSIILTCVLIFYVLTPMILVGIHPVLATVIVCLVSTALTMYLVGGFNRKSTSATIGCTLSIIFAGLLSYLTVKLAYLTGFAGENVMFLYTAHPELNFIGILISAMILATLGAVMDVAMSIASTVNEIYTVDNTKTVKELFKSGMNVGRDIIGTMANTLILVYIGGSLPLLLLASNIDLYKFINLNQVVTEIASALIGSCAIVVCVPLTAIVASNLVRLTHEEPFE